VDLGDGGFERDDAVGLGRRVGDSGELWILIT
jgi:hypothetical protein